MRLMSWKILGMLKFWCRFSSLDDRARQQSLKNFNATFRLSRASSLYAWVTLNSDKKNHYTSNYNVDTTALQHLAIVCVCTHSCYIMSVTTTVLLHCLAPSESSANVNGQSHLCVTGKAGDVTRKPTVMPATVTRTDIGCSNGVTVIIVVVRGKFVKAQFQTHATWQFVCMLNNMGNMDFM